ncbi:hypothetical protein [Natronococcus occultus]|uniref:Uncharacterized protein n=1 Tax=Natronococcus occultus SP4 TaxID=694430 RepID=L0JXS7_9EURY|nr:hypothetical protein [Natronococcus occultus]AGB37110.1 hypothetical protein Natoc_1287 [Natronococcus occultus SP4]
MSGEEEEKFDYQGYLIFNGIYETDLAVDSKYRRGLIEAEAELLADLGQFEDTKRESDRGVEKIPLRDYIRDDDSVSGELEELAGQLISLRFLYEDRIEKDGYLSGKKELQKVEIPIIKDADIYWIYPNYMYFRGAKDDVTEAIEYTSSILDADIASDGGTAVSPQQPSRFSKFQSISFHADFLLWLFSHQYNGTDLPGSAIEIDTLTDASVTGNTDVWGGNNIVGDTTQLIESPPLLSAILQNKSLKMIEGGFAMGDNTIKSKIQIDKVHIKSSAKSIKKSNNTRRMSLSLRFLNELVELEKYWNNLDPKNKYPPYTFFLDLFDTCQAHGMTLDNISEILRREYCDKRGDNNSEWDL